MACCAAPPAPRDPLRCAASISPVGRFGIGLRSHGSKRRRWCEHGIARIARCARGPSSRGSTPGRAGRAGSPLPPLPAPIRRRKRGSCRLRDHRWAGRRRHCTRESGEHAGTARVSHELDVAGRARLTTVDRPSPHLRPAFCQRCRTEHSSLRPVDLSSALLLRAARASSRSSAKRRTHVSPFRSETSTGATAWTRISSRGANSSKGSA